MTTRIENLPSASQFYGVTDSQRDRKTYTSSFQTTS